MKQFSVDDYDFSIFETKTGEVIENVDKFRSELGILYLNDFNRDVLTKLFTAQGLSFHKLFDCHIYVFLGTDHPLAKKERIKLEELMDYPCLAFDQGDANSFYFAEELFSTYEYKQIIHANDRGTMLNQTSFTGKIIFQAFGSFFLTYTYRNNRCHVFILPFFQFCNQFFVSNRLDEVVPSSWQVLQVSEK